MPLLPVDTATLPAALLGLRRGRRMRPCAYPLYADSMLPLARLLGVGAAMVEGIESKRLLVVVRGASARTCTCGGVGAITGGLDECVGTVVCA